MKTMFAVVLTAVIGFAGSSIRAEEKPAAPLGTQAEKKDTSADPVQAAKAALKNAEEALKLAKAENKGKGEAGAAAVKRAEDGVATAKAAVQKAKDDAKAQEKAKKDAEKKAEDAKKDAEKKVEGAEKDAEKKVEGAEKKARDTKKGAEKAYEGAVCPVSGKTCPACPDCKDGKICGKCQAKAGEAKAAETKK